jgi:hypothetical protein
MSKAVEGLFYPWGKKKKFMRQIRGGKVKNINTNK